MAVPRLVTTLLPDSDEPPLGEHVLGDTAIELPAGGPTSYRNVLTDSCACVRQIDGRSTLLAAEVFQHFPIAFLEPPQW